MPYSSRLVPRICTGCKDRMWVYADCREDEKDQAFCSWDCMHRYDKARRETHDWRVVEDRSKSDGHQE
jgi:hypothetical protein